jgi:hypothetical protein
MALSSAQRVALPTADVLDRPDVVALLEAALELASTSMSDSAGRELLIKSISGKQRPRQ